jgi:hypothetical protein
MISRRLVTRIAQVILVLVLGLSVHATGTGACLDCDTCPSPCGSRSCGHCPADWWGDCYAGTEGCGHYGCTEVGQCCSIGQCKYTCDCLPCIEG